MAIEDEPRALAADVLTEIIQRIKQSRPTRTDGQATSGFVFAQQFPGQMISPRDFARPWAPFGAAKPPRQGLPGMPAAPAPDPAAATDEIKRAMRAASNTATLFDTLLMVTDDMTMQTYGGGGRKLTVAYESILQAMECGPLPEQTPETKARVEAAKKVLWDADNVPTSAYQRYLDNAEAYGDAKAAFLTAQDAALNDPAKADSWPLLATTFQAKVEHAWDRWKSQNADEIETALAITQSTGVPLEQGMIASARKLLADWMVGITGTADEVPYVTALPSEWALIEADDIGWTKLTKNSSSYSSHHARNGYGVSQGSWSGESESSSGSAGVGIFGFGFSGSHTSSSTSATSAFSSDASDGTSMKSDARNLSVELEYGLVQIVRPWMMTDLFRMRNWYLRGERAGVISDGTIDNQIGKDSPLLPMIPTHVLVVRNVRISTNEWGSVQDTLQTYWSRSDSSSSSSASSTSGSASIPVWGPFSVSGGYSRSDSRYAGDVKDESGRAFRDDSGSYFDGNTLHINGAQIVAWLGEIIPAAPPLADPALDAAESADGTPAAEPAPVG